jgi:hypothetical protein
MLGLAAALRGHWNVALWIGNDEPMYRLALDCIAIGR